MLPYNHLSKRVKNPITKNAASTGQRARRSRGKCLWQRVWRAFLGIVLLLPALFNLGGRFGDRIVYAKGIEESRPVAARGQGMLRAEDFGFRRLKVNGVPARGERPLLVILLQYSDVRFRAPHTPGYYDRLLFGPEGQNIADYFRENSRGTFTWIKAGIVGPLSYPDDPFATTRGVNESRYLCAGNQTKNGIQLCPGASGKWEQTLTTAVRLAATRGGFDYSRYDLNRDGKVTADELTILIIGANPPLGTTVFPVSFADAGAARAAWPNACVQIPSRRGRRSGDPPLSVCTRSREQFPGVVSAGEGVGFATLAHELSHTLGTEDIYGDNSRLNGQMSLMAGTIFGRENDLRTFHLDPWHKIQLGWASPYGIFSVLEPGLARLSSAHFNRPVILYDPRRSKNEYFILEHRARWLEYDQDIPDEGLAVWYVETDARGALRDISAPTGGTDKSNFLLGSHPCNIADPTWTRGESSLWKQGDFRLRWLDGKDSGILVRYLYQRVHDPIRVIWRVDNSDATNCTFLTQTGIGKNEGGDQFGRTLAAGYFNNDGFFDLAVGAPNEAPGSDPESGAVFTFRGSPTGLQHDKVITQEGLGLNERGDKFGAALAVGDFNGDHIFDLAVGAPGEAPGSAPRSGAVFVFRGSPTGFQPEKVITQQGLDPNESGDNFGVALSVGDFDNDGIHDLAVGASGESLGFRPASGAVYIFRGSPTGLQPDKALTQSDLDENGIASLFGQALVVGHFDNDAFIDLAVGAPGKDLGSGLASGAVYIFRGSPTGLQPGKRITQNGIGLNEVEDRFGYSLAVGDFDNDGLSDLAVGAPGEAPDSDPKSGVVFIFRGSPTGLQPEKRITQASVGSNEAGDQFGYALTAADLNNDGVSDLVVGAPGEAPGLDPRSGAVFVFGGSPNGLQVQKSITQSGIGKNEAGDRFGCSLVTGDFDRDGTKDLAVGAFGEAPGSDPNSGVVFIFPGLRTTITRNMR